MGKIFFNVIGDPIQRGLGCLLNSLATFLLGFLVKRDMVMKILTLQDFYESLIYLGFISINENYNQRTRLKNYLKYIHPLGYYYLFSERWKIFYDTLENMPLDNTLPVLPNHAGHSSSKTFMMYVCVYNSSSF